MSEDLGPCSAALLLQKSLPDAALTSFFSTSSSQAGSLSTSLGKMSARPGQAYARVIGTSRELQVRRWKNLVPGEGQMASHQPVTALRSLKPTLGFPSETELPTSLHPLCPWQSTQPAMPCQPMSWETLPRLDSLCHLPVVTLHRASLAFHRAALPGTRLPICSLGG